MADRVVSFEFTSKGANRVTSSMSDIEKAANKTATGTQSATTKIGNSFKGLNTSIKSGVSGLSALSPAGLLAGAGLLGVAAGISSVVNAGRDLERQNRLTSAAIISTGDASGTTTEQIHNLADSQSVLTGVTANTIQSAANMVLRFQDVRNEAGKTNDIFDQTVKSSLDLAAGFGVSVTQAAKVLGKALEDPVKGMTQLRRAGIVLDEQQQAQIKTFVAAGNTLGAQKVILDQVKTSFGGAAAAAADPVAKFDAQVTELKQSIGADLLPAVNAAVGALSKLFSVGSSSGKHSFLGDSSSTGQGLSGALDFLTGKGELGLVGKIFGGGGSTDPGTRALNNLDAAQKQLNKDAADAHTPQAQLAKDADAVHAAQSGVDAITRRVSGALGDNTTVVDAAKFGYLGLASSVTTAKDALTAITTSAFAPLQANIAVDTGTTAVQSALDALNHPDTGSSSGGGSGQTATAAALDRADKQNTLTQAKEDAITASKNLNDAEKAYSDILNGVSANSKAAKDAQVALTQAQDASKSSTLDLIDAQRNLADAKDAAANAGHTAQEGAQGAGLNLASAQLDVRDAQAALVIARESEDPETIQRAQIALGQAQLQVAQATDANTSAQKQLGEVGKKNSTENENVKRAQIAVTEAQIAQKQATDNLTAAQRTLNDTLNGFPASSQEAQTAQQNLQSAQDQTRDSTAALIRAQADLDGKLTASSGAASAGKKLDSLTTRIDNAKTAIIDLAASAGQADLLAGHSFGHSILVEMGVLQAYAAANPLLANVFGPALTTLSSDFAKNLAQIQGHPGTTGANQTSAQRKSLGFAGGGYASAGSTFTVGEAGYEIAHARVGGGVDILSNSQSRRSLSRGNSSGLTINVYGPVYGEMDFKKIAVQAVREHYDNGGRSLDSRAR